MKLGKINIITPPDKLFNHSASILLVKPSLEVKEALQQYLSRIIEELNIFVYDQNEMDIDWLLSVHHIANITIIDIDNCDPITRSFITFMIAQTDTYYITKDEITPYILISKNRIYDLDSIPFFKFVQNPEEGEDE